jgi:hypothetical protein
VEYGTTVAYGNLTTEINTPPSGVTTHTDYLTGLTTCTTYHYRVISTDDSSNPATGSDNTFTTTGTGCDTTDPVITNIASSATENAATITWDTDELSTTQVFYGLTTSYGSSTGVTDTSGSLAHTADLSNLTSCTTYHYQVSSTDMSSNNAVGVDQTFTTACTSNSSGSGSGDSDDEDECEVPDDPDLNKVLSESTTSLRVYYDEVSGSVDNYSLKYGTSSGSYSWRVDDIGDGDEDDYLVGELLPGTQYYFKVRAENDCGKGGWSNEKSGTTDQPALESTSSTEEVTIIETAVEEPVVNETEIEPTVNTQPQENFNGSTSTQWQKVHFGELYCYDRLVCGGQADPDKDSVINDDEYRFKTDPNQPDSDNDGVEDSKEILAGKDPAKRSTDTEDDKVEYEDAKKKKDKEDDKKHKVDDVELIEQDGKKKLKITGTAQPYQYVTLYLYSEEPTIVVVKTDANGSWSYTFDGEDVEDGEHEVYVAVTNNTGKIITQSTPVAFVKTAEAVERVDASNPEAAAYNQSPLEKSKNNIFLFSFIASAIAIVLIILFMYWRHKRQSKGGSVTGYDA